VGDADRFGGPKRDDGIGNARGQQRDNVAACHSEFPEQPRDAVQPTQERAVAQADGLGFHRRQKGDCRRFRRSHSHVNKQTVDGRPIFGGYFRIGVYRLPN
jgi:hypothetical protein